MGVECTPATPPATDDGAVGVDAGGQQCQEIAAERLCVASGRRFDGDAVSSTRRDACNHHSLQRLDGPCLQLVPEASMPQRPCSAPPKGEKLASSRQDGRV